MKGWRTLTANLVASLLPLLDQFGVADFVPDRYMLWYVLAVIAMNLFLRMITTSPVGRPE